MRLFWQRFIAALTPGVKVLLILMVVASLSAVIGEQTRAFDLYGWLALSSPDFFHGQYWRIVTYALLPTGIIGFLTNSLALVMVGAPLERVWSRSQFWIYCLICVAGAGLVKLLMASASSQALVGAAPLVLGLVVGWAFVCGNDAVPFLMFGPVTARQVALILIGISFITMFFSAGLAAALIMTAGGVVGWLYLWLRQKCLMARSPRVAASERISRLEL